MSTFILHHDGRSTVLRVDWSSMGKKSGFIFGESSISLNSRGRHIINVSVLRDPYYQNSVEFSYFGKQKHGNSCFSHSKRLPDVSFFPKFIASGRAQFFVGGKIQKQMRHKLEQRLKANTTGIEAKCPKTGRD